MEKSRRASLLRERRSPATTYLYRLPDDREVVQLVAMGSGMYEACRCIANGCKCKQRRFPSHYNGPALPLLVQECVRYHIALEHAGKRGTNDPTNFQRIWAQILPRWYVAFYDLLISTPEAVAHLRTFRDDRELLAYLNKLSQAQIGLLALPDDVPLPLKWRLLEEKAVA